MSGWQIAQRMVSQKVAEFMQERNGEGRGGGAYIAEGGGLLAVRVISRHQRHNGRGRELRDSIQRRRLAHVIARHRRHDVGRELAQGHANTGYLE